MSAHGHEHHACGHCSTGEAPAPVGEGKVTDPVCGMQVDPATTAHHATYAGQDYHFCSARCRERFVAEPTTFLSPQPEPARRDPDRR